ncbi:hypothetical protein [Pontibacter akesuensis]|uniref:Uncharacterized protein n=1 Tax=Pontibacter akesuensis TaxID=388950 RepID=A0A1I7KLE1_9BACT|nr:hypothetical protein [Pontibacter akesuensis]GHA77929.1 hypothetical protein GCM10007389_34710 [Pontibacter akesuensis]SFU98255.1 hypothetical protein SAMN04487941_3839 [Pontibacter akesuensis]
MERDNRNYHREFERKLHNDNDRFTDRGRYGNSNQYGNRNSYGSRDNDRRQDSDRSFENYRDRYDNQRGNYYGLKDENYEYRNVRSTGSNAYGSGPVGGYGASSYRGATNSNNQDDDYHYGDRNPYMNNRRNTNDNSGSIWDSHDRYGTTGGNQTTNYSAGRSNSDYSRQDNSYQYGGQGRRYEDFNRDENKKMTKESGYNMLGIDAYKDRGEHRRSASDNNYRRSSDSNRFYEGHYNNDERTNRGTTRNSGSSDDNYATGLYASNRAYNSDQRNNDSDDYDFSERSSRYRKPGERSGPNYGASSGASDYGHDGTRG